MQDTNHLQGKVTTHFPAAEDWIQSINSRCTCKFRKSALSLVLFFLFSQTIFEINSAMIPFILCTYSSLTWSSKLWANSRVRVSWSQFQSCRNVQPTAMSRLTTMNHNSCAVSPLSWENSYLCLHNTQSTPHPCMFLRWLKCFPHSLFSWPAFALLWLSQNLSQTFQQKKWILAGHLTELSHEHAHLPDSCCKETQLEPQNLLGWQRPWRPSSHVKWIAVCDLLQGLYP